MPFPFVLKSLGARGRLVGLSGVQVDSCEIQGGPHGQQTGRQPTNRTRNLDFPVNVIKLSR
eukprot:5920385-Pyramimonas_sp.AAC.1